MKKKYIQRRILIFLVTISITTGEETWSKPDSKGLETDWIPVNGKCLSCKPSKDLQPEASDDQIKKVLSPPYPQTNFLFPPPNPSQYQLKQPRVIEHTPNIQFIPQYSQDNKYYQKLQQPFFFQLGANQLNPHKFVFDPYKPVHNVPQQFVLPQFGYPYLQPQLLKSQEPLKSDGKWRFDTNIALNGGNQQYHKIRFPDSNITVKNPQPIVKPEIQEVQLLYVPVETLMHQKGRALKNMKINIDRPSSPFIPYQQPQITYSENSHPPEVIKQETITPPTFESHYNPQRPNDYFHQPPNPYVPSSPPEVVRQENNFPSTTAPSIESSYIRQNENHYPSQPPNAYIGNAEGGILRQSDKVQPSNQQAFETYPQKSVEYFPPPRINSYNEVVGNAGNSAAVRNVDNQFNQQPTSPSGYESYNIYSQKTKEYFPENKHPDNSVTGAVNSETQVVQESTTPRIYESHYNAHTSDSYFPQPQNPYLVNSGLIAQGNQAKQESTTQQIHPLNSVKSEYFTQQQHYFPSSPPSQHIISELQKNTEPLTYENLHSSTTQKEVTTTSPLPASTTPQSQTTPYFGTYYSVHQGIFETKSPELIPASTSEQTPQVTSSSQDQRFSYSEAFSQYPEQTSTYPVPHQPPLSVYMERLQNSKLNDILNILKYSKTVPVLDYIDENSPQVFVGPSELQAPKGYVKFDLPYLSSLDSNRIERMIDRLPFFVAPLNFKPPSGYSKIPFPAPHIGSVVVSNTTTFKDIHDKLQQKYVPAYQQTTTTTTTAPDALSSTIWTEQPSTRNPTRYQSTTTKKYRQRRPIHRGFPSTTERTTQASERYHDSTSKPDESAYIIPVTNIPEANSSSYQGFPNDYREVPTPVKQYSNEFNRIYPASQQYTNELNPVTIPVKHYPNDINYQTSTPEQYPDFNQQTSTTSKQYTEFNQQSTHSQQYPNEYTQFSFPSQQYPIDHEHVSTPIQQYSTNLNQNPTISDQHLGEISEKLFPSQQHTSELNQVSAQSPQYSNDLSHVPVPHQHYSIGFDEKTAIGQESNIQNQSNFQNIKPLSQFMPSEQSSENQTYNKNEVPWSPNPDYYTLPVTAGYQNFLDQTKSSNPTIEEEKSTIGQDETTTRSSEILRVRAKQRVSPSRYHYPRNQYTTESTEATTTTEHESTRPNRRRRPIRPTTSTESRTYRGRSTKQPAYLRRRTTTTEQDTFSSTTGSYETPSSTEKNSHDSEAFWNEPVTVYHNGFTSSNPSVYDNVSSTGHDVLSSTSDIASNEESQPIEKDRAQAPNEVSQSFAADQEIPKAEKVNNTESVENISGSDVEDSSWELSKERLLLKQDSDSQKKAYDQQEKKVTPGRRRGTWVRKIRLKKPQDVFETAESQNLAHLTNNDIKTDTKSTTESSNQDISLHTDFTDMLTQLLSDKNEEVNTTNGKEILKEENNEKDNEAIDSGYNEESDGSTSDNQKGDENKTDIEEKNAEPETEKIRTDEYEEKSTDVPEVLASSTSTMANDVGVENGIKNVSERAEGIEKEENGDTSSNIIATSTTTEISLETEICYKGKCVKSKKTKASDLLPVE